MAAKPVVVSQNWSVQVDSLNVSDAGAMLTAIKSLTPFTLLWDEVSTTDNQTPEEAAFARTGTATSRIKVGEGNGTPLQHSCQENPMDGGAW